MTIITPKLSPGKGRWPRSAAKRAKRRYLLRAAAQYKEASERRYGTLGAASPVRRIDPVTGKLIEETKTATT
jgi:hypothetical protein